MATTSKERSRAAKPAAARNGSGSRAATEFAPGSLESELSGIGRSAPAEEWAKVPSDYFADLDRYLHGAPKQR